MRISDWSSDVCSSDLAMPEEYGGSGLGMSEAALMMHTISRSGAGFSGASAVHMNIFGLNPVVVFGPPDQRRSEERRVVKSVSVRLDLGCRRILKKKNKQV